MKIIQHINGVVVDIINARHDVTIDNIIVVDNIPTFEPRKGYNGILTYNGEELLWRYDVVPATSEITDTEALDIITGGVDV